jgi:hypothetical protein
MNNPTEENSVTVGFVGGESRQAVESAIGVIKGNRTTKWEDLAKGSPVGKWGATRTKDEYEPKAAP